jgi:hypothetical protein
MKLALIPPVSLIDDIFRTDYQLVLPHVTDERYIEAYRSARKRGDYLILDNGAAEGGIAHLDHLFGIAFDLMVNEIVVPDVLGDYLGTVQEVQTFETYLKNHQHDFEQFNYMAVVQGQNWDEICSLVDFYSQINWVTSLGIPRILCDTLDDAGARVGVIRYVAETYGNRFQIHLLGTNPRYIRELVRFGPELDKWGVRGVDTSAPFNYANCGKFIDHFDSIERPGGYFQLDAHHFGRVQVKHNLEVMLEWTSATSPQ